MKSAHRYLAQLSAVVCLAVLCGHALAQQKKANPDTPIVLKVSILLDGRGQVLHNQRIVIAQGRIVKVEPLTKNESAAVTYDLRGLTVMPGWIDTHVHIDWHFGPNGTMRDPAETPEQAAAAIRENARKTLLAGFTTVQSVGAPPDAVLREAIKRGETPGPRVLTSLRQLTDAKLTADEFRAAVRQLKQDRSEER